MPKLKIEKIYAFIAEDKEGEGLIGMKFNDTYMPFVCADMERVNSLMLHAKAIAKQSGKVVKLVEFSNATILIDDILQVEKSIFKP